MFKWLSLLVVILSYFDSNGQNRIDTGKSSIVFKIKNFGIPVNGSVSGLKGDIHFDKKDPGSSHFSVSVQMGTINTGIGARDKHIKKAEWLFVDKFSVSSFNSNKVWLNSDGQYQVTGILTIKGTSKSISFPFTAKDVNGGTKFLGSFTINRREFGVGGSSLSMSDNLSIILSVFAD